MSERETMIAAVLTSPDEEAVRLILADFLEELGEEDACRLRLPGQWLLENTDTVRYTGREFQRLIWECLPESFALRCRFDLGPIPGTILCQATPGDDVTDEAFLACRRYNGRWLCSSCFYAETAKPEEAASP